MRHFSDFQLLAQNFEANSSGLTAEEFALLNRFASGFGDQLVSNPDGVGFSLVSVPEPASALAICGIAGLLARRRRSPATAEKARSSAALRAAGR